MVRSTLYCQISDVNMEGFFVQVLVLMALLIRQGFMSFSPTQVSSGFEHFFVLDFIQPYFPQYSPVEIDISLFLRAELLNKSLIYFDCRQLVNGLLRAVVYNKQSDAYHLPTLKKYVCCVYQQVPWRLGWCPFSANVFNWQDAPIFSKVYSAEIIDDMGRLLDVNIKKPYIILLELRIQNIFVTSALLYITKILYLSNTIGLILAL